MKSLDFMIIKSVVFLIIYVFNLLLYLLGVFDGYVFIAAILFLVVMTLLTIQHELMLKKEI